MPIPPTYIQFINLHPNPGIIGINKNITHPTLLSVVTNPVVSPSPIGKANSTQASKYKGIALWTSSPPTIPVKYITHNFHPRTP